jgi:hypothetical protein
MDSTNSDTPVADCTDVLGIVFSYLSSTRDILNCALVCRAWRAVISAEDTATPVLLPYVSLRLFSNAHTAWLRQNIHRITSLKLQLVECGPSLGSHRQDVLELLPAAEAGAHAACAVSSCFMQLLSIANDQHVCCISQPPLETGSICYKWPLQNKYVVANTGRSKPLYCCCCCCAAHSPHP